LLRATGIRDVDAERTVKCISDAEAGIDDERARAQVLGLGEALDGEDAER
jgi:hypothetical protein